MIYTFKTETNRYLSIGAGSEDEAMRIANSIIDNNYSSIYPPIIGTYKKLELVNISPVILINDYYKP